MKLNRVAVYNKYNGRCAYCGCQITLKTMHVDHIIAKGRGGSDDIVNLHPACADCNRWKKVFTVEEFRSEMEAQAERAKLYSRNYKMALKFGLVEVVRTEIFFYFETVARIERG